MTNNVLFPRKVYYGAVVLLLLLLASTLYHRISHFDDAWCTEQSYWLLKDGIVRSELFRGYNYWHERLYVFHKAFVYVQALLLSGVGFSVWGARTTPMLFTAVGLGLLLLYFRRKPEHQWLAATLYIGCGCLWIFGVDNRPDSMVAAFGFASYMLLRRPDASFLRLLLAGVLAGIAGLTHLNGIIYVAAGTFWLLAHRGWLRAGWFGLVGTLTVSTYLLDAALDNQIDRLVYQFTHDHVTQSNLHWWSKLAVMADYHRLFMHSEGETFLTVLFLVVVVVLWRHRPSLKLLTPSMQYLLLLLGLFWLLTKSNNVYYFLLFVPFLIATLVELTLAAAPLLTQPQRLVVVVAFCAYPLGGLIRAFYLVRENQTYPNTLVENARLAAYMPQQGAKIIAPIDFFFGQMNNYRVRGLTYYALLNANEYAGQLPLDTFFALATQDSVRYIVTDQRTWNQAYQVPADAPSQIGPYQRVFQDKWHSVYVRRDSLPQVPPTLSSNY
ncbi:glycosyltransferase family 39 protein [Hymenobacter tibetensis]|uniref:Glycosyltransferase family 39 protein n=1 Tax=Hymenobacter tibetensis TaxID=497967 RepID=A0ABY4D300_9BACT|nr:glycosyltransferase family 39 protein [Hymenobacter tibetensis]UOG76900.1 glycosyltransferase family 39 protein [Hymenobacter tibetensis]